MALRKCSIILITTIIIVRILSTLNFNAWTQKLETIAITELLLIQHYAAWFYNLILFFEGSIFYVIF